jgi:hypothetical protein
MGITKAPTFSLATNTPTTPRQTLTWDPYKPQLIKTDWDFAAQTPYSGAESGALAKLNEIIKYGGYSPETKQTMLTGAMQPVYQQAETASEAATRNAYARGLGQSGVMQRSLTDIQKGVGSSMAQIAGGIEQQSAAQVMPAIGAVQSGQQNIQQMLLNNAKYNADLAQEREQLATTLNMKLGDLQVAISELNSTLDMSDADRQVKLTEIANNYNLDATKLEVLQEEAKKDRTAGLWASLLGGAMNVTGGVLGKVLKPAAAAA